MDILLVEDSPEVSLITVEYLTELGHCVTPVPSAESAIESVARQRFDAVITDVSLPGMSGLDLAKALLKEHPRLPVIISSGYGSLDTDFVHAYPGSRVRVLPKPYDMDTLEQTLLSVAVQSGTGSPR